MIDKISIVVASVWPSGMTLLLFFLKPIVTFLASVRTYGSFETSLAIPTSDLDLVIIGASQMSDGQLNTLAAGINVFRVVMIHE